MYKFIFRSLMAAAMGVVCSVSPSLAAQGLPANIGRTEEDDIAELEVYELSNNLPSLGAIKVPVTVKQDGNYTVAIYSKQGALIRIIGQMLYLKKGTHDFRWDGMDVYGHLIPDGTKVDVKTIYNPGVKAFYEFTVGSANQLHPWGNGYLKGEPGTSDMRWAGWMGDHGTPSSMVGVGDFIVAGHSMSEQGNNIALMDLQGNVIWTNPLAGWTGPDDIKTDGKDIYAKSGGTVYKLSLLGIHRDKNGKVRGKNKKKFHSAGRDKLKAYAVGKDRMLTFNDNHEIKIDPFRRSRPKVDLGNSQPQILNTVPLSAFHASPAGAFKSTLGSRGQPQTGASMIKKQGAAYTVFALEKPVSFGAIHLGPVKNVAKMELFMLRSDIKKYDTLVHSPLRKKDTDEVLGDLDISDMDENWVKIGEVKPSGSWNMINTKQPFVTTRAIYFKATPKKGVKFNNWKPRILNASMYVERIKQVKAKPRVILPMEMIEKVHSERSAGWHATTKEAITREQPVPVIFDYGKPVTFDGVGFFEALSGHVVIDKYVGDPNKAPSNTSEGDWEEVATLRLGSNRALGSYSSAKHQNNRFVRIMDRTTTRAIRLRVVQGYTRGKWSSLFKQAGGFNQDRPTYMEVTEVGLFTLPNNPVKPKYFVLKQFDKEGKLATALKTDEHVADVMCFGDDNQWYTIKGNELRVSSFDGKKVSHRVINSDQIVRAADIQVRNGVIAVADRGRSSVLIFDTSGNFVRQIGSGNQRDIGKWDPYDIGKLTGVALTSDGDVWISEGNFQPKRYARFTSEGKLRNEYFGMARYGGGGHLDPNLRWFYYRGVRWEMDFEKGTSWVSANYDRPYREHTFDPTPGTFGHSGFNKPTMINGIRYMTGYGGGAFGIGRLNDDEYRTRPMVLMGSAYNSTFLLTKEVWKDEFATADLVGKHFLWTDLNDDGDYQRNELQIFDKGETGVVLGADTRRNKKGTPVFPTGGILYQDYSLTNGNFKIHPERITPGGVPVYDMTKWKWQPNPAPVLHSTFLLGGSSSAKPYYGGFMAMLKDGSVIREAQPYVVTPTGQVAGGPGATKSSNFQPEVNGVIVNQFWRFAGVEETDSDVGEVTLINSNNGYWYIYAARYGVLIGTLFDGSAGQFSAKAPAAIRGTEVTHYRNMWEGWGSNFIRANNGNYYASMGKIWHGIYRVEGLHDFKLESFELTIPKGSMVKNTKLRPALVSRSHARRVATNKTTRTTYAVKSIEQRTSKFQLDGMIEDWGMREKFQPIGPAKEGQLVDMTYDNKGLYLAWSGENRLQNKGKNWKTMFNTGFNFEVMIRSDSRNRSRDLAAGDKRIVFSKYKGKWIAVLYDYRTQSPRGEGLVFDSALGHAKIADVRKLTEHEIKVFVNDRSLGINLDDLEQLEDDFGEAPGTVNKETKGRELPKGFDHWTAEVFIPWSTIGHRPIGYNSTLRIDFGVSNANAAGTGVDRRRNWNDRSSNYLGDLGLEASLNPGAWGYLAAWRKPRK